MLLSKPARVIVPLKVQDGVDDQVREVGFEGLALIARLPRDDRRAKHDVPLHQTARRHVGKAQHIGGVVLATVAAIEAPSFSRADDPDGDLAGPLQRRACPAADLCRSGGASGVRPDLQVELEPRFRHGDYSSPWRS